MVKQEVKEISATIWNNETVRKYISGSGCHWNDDTYINMKQKLCITMRCGHIHNTSLDSFKRSRFKVCRKCLPKYNKANKKYTIETIKDIAKTLGVVVISDSYSDIFDPLEFRCRCGDTFITNWSEFNNGGKNTCNKCSLQRKADALTLDINNVKQRVSEMSECVLLSTEYIDAHSTLEFQCECGRVFTRSWANFTNKGKRKCPTCNARYSENEATLVTILNDFHVSFYGEYSFSDCQDIGQLRFDFFLPGFNTCIEVDGEHHFEPLPHFGGGKRFIEIKTKDKIKDSYCEDNGINLIRIPYWEFSDIEKVIRIVKQIVT